MYLSNGLAYPSRDRSAMANVEWFSGTERNIPLELGLASVAIGAMQLAVRLGGYFRPLRNTSLPTPPWCYLDVSGYILYLTSCALTIMTTAKSKQVII